MRAVMCVDVEPDLRETEVPGPASWRGADHLLADPSWLRVALSPDGDGVINWFVRIDEQIQISNGSSTFGAERYLDAFERFGASGDEVGLHPHNWRWDASAERWVSDGSDEWVEQVVKRALEDFSTAFGWRCRSFRYGDRFVSAAATRTLLDDPDVVVDVGVEPGPPSVRGLVPHEASIGRVAHVDLALANCYQPAPDDPGLPADVDGRLTVVPLTCAAVPGAASAETLVLWNDPDRFERMLRLRLLDGELDHLAFAIRTDLAVLPFACANITANLLRLRTVVPDLTWVPASSLALQAGAVVPGASGVVGAMARELDAVLDLVSPTGVAGGPGGVAAAVEGQLHERDIARRALETSRDAAACDRAAAERELDGVTAELGAARAALDELRTRFDAATARAEAAEHELHAIEATSLWRARARLLPVLRLAVAVRRRLAR